MADTQNHDDPQKPAAGARLDRSVVLIGLMGVGKSTVGRRLAQMLDMDFADADDEIESAAQLSIAEIFERFGEDYFRDGERRVIHRMLHESPRIIATGGGAFMDPQTRTLILNDALAVWLQADLETLAERVSRRDTRPLLRGRDPLQVLTDLAKTRNPVYARAPIHVASRKGPHHVTATAIKEAIETWLSSR